MPQQILSQTEIDAYSRDGYLVPQFRFSGDKVNRLQKLADEIIAASKNEGASVKKKEDTHKMADANKAFSHFRF